MATAIATVSESSDHYLYMYENESIEEILSDMKMNPDFSLLRVENIKSTVHDVADLRIAVCSAIEESYIEEYGE